MTCGEEAILPPHNTSSSFVFEDLSDDDAQLVFRITDYKLLPPLHGKAESMASLLRDPSVLVDQSSA